MTQLSGGGGGEPSAAPPPPPPPPPPALPLPPPPEGAAQRPPSPTAAGSSDAAAAVITAVTTTGNCTATANQVNGAFHVNGVPHVNGVAHVNGTDLSSPIDAPDAAQTASPSTAGNAATPSRTCHQQYPKQACVLDREIAGTAPEEPETVPLLPAPFRLLHGEYVSRAGRVTEGRLYLTNYRLYLQAETAHGLLNLPLGLLETAESRDICYLHVQCKDARAFR